MAQVSEPVAWTFACGGSYTEELAWLTDVLQAPTGGTQHRRLRQSPRTTVSFQALESGAYRRWMDLLLRANSAGRWWVPIAVDARQLAVGAFADDTVLDVDIDGARFTTGGHVLLIGSSPRTFEVREIASIGTATLTLATGLAQAWGPGTQVIPLRTGRLAAMPQVGRFTSDDSALVTLQFRLEEPLDVAPAWPGSTYRGYPVFDTLAPVWMSDPTWTPERLIDLQDDDISVPVVTDTAGIALGKTTMHYAPTGQDQVAAFRSALFAMAGRWAPVWVPSWAHDLRVVAPAAAGQAFLDVQGPLLSTQPLAANHRDIRIALANGTVLYRRITAVTAQGSAVDRLTLDTALPAAFAVSAVQMVCFLSLSVQDADTNALRYFDADTTLECELTWRELAHGL